MNVEEKELQRTFRDAAAPREEFLNALKKEVVSTASTKVSRSNLLSSIMMKLSQTQLKFGAIAAFVFVGVGATVMYSLWAPRTTFVANQSEIFANIAAANSNRTQNKIANNSPVVGNKTATSSDLASPEKMSALWYQDPKTRGYDYKKTTTTYNTGKGSQKCTPMIPYAGEITKEESIQYFSKSEDYQPSHTKYVTYNGNNVFDYNLTVGTSQWQYKGGSYAVQLKNVQRVSPLAAENLKIATPQTDYFAIDGSGSNGVTSDIRIAEPIDTVTPTDQITSYFGEDAKIVGTETVNGKKFYRIQWTFNGSCSQSVVGKDAVVSNNSSDTIAVESLADAETFVITEESYYYQKFGSANLIYSRKTVEETAKSLSAASVESIFTFEFPVTVKVIDAASFKYEEQYQKALVAYLAQKGMNPLVISTKGYSLQSASSNNVSIVPEQDKHLVDRDFYANNEYGQSQYDQNKDMFKPYVENGVVYPELLLSYESSTKVSWATVAQYTGDIDTQKALKSSFGVDTTLLTGKGTVAIMVDGKSVAGQVFEQKDETRSMPGSSNPSTGDVAPVPEVEVSPFVTRYFVIKSGDKTVIIMTSLDNKVAVADIAKSFAFSTIQSSDSAKLQTALTTVQATRVRL
jgi:hypothetical protein